MIPLMAADMINREKLVLEELYGSVIESIVLDYKYNIDESVS
mgnify:CR=1 FL=1